MMTQTDLQLIDELLTKRLAPVKRDIRTIKKDMQLVIRFFDSEILALGRRVEKIEEHIGFPTE